MKGFIDESGTENASKYLAISLVVFESEKDLHEFRANLDILRRELKLPKDFEFHRAHNTLNIKMAVEKVLKSSNFFFYTILISKKRRPTSLNYEYLAKKLVFEIKSANGRLDIKLDSNPTLRKKLHKILKSNKISNIKVSESESQKYDGLQAADYIVNISRHKAERKYSQYQYQKLFKKCTGFHIIEP